MKYNKCVTIVIALALFTTLLISGTAYAQSITDYNFFPSNGTFTALTGATAPALVSGGSLDDGYYPIVPIGFTFNFNGISYTTMSASTNGWFTFDQLASTALTNNLTTGTPRPIIAPLWDDLELNATTGVFSYKTEGTTPNQIFTAEWLNVEWSYSAVGPAISFQVKLYEATGKIEFIYRPEANPVVSGSASIGIAAVATGAGNFLSLDGTGTSPNVSSTTEYTTLSVAPASGQIYAFDPRPFPRIVHTPLASDTTTAPKLVSAVITSSVGLAGSPNQPRMYYRTGTTGAYTAVVMTNTTGNTWQATIPGFTGGTTIQYYIAAQDISVPPLVMTAPTGGSGANPPGSTPPATPYQYMVSIPLAGGTIYPINGVQNAPVSFSNITNAAAYVTACGVTGTGQVILELSTGYTGEPAFPITFGAIAGASATLGVTIRPAVGTSAFTIEGSGVTGIFNLNGVNYLTIDGRPGGTGTSHNIIISNTSTAGPAIQYITGASYNTVKYCILKSVNTSTSSGVVFISTAGTTTGNNYNNIQYCDITSGTTYPYYGVYISGTSGLVNTNNTITHCNIYDFSNTGIYIYSYNNGTTVTYNDIHTVNIQSSTTLQGIDIHASTSGGSIITNNKIYNFLSSATPTFRGIYLYYGSSTIVTTIANNFICFDATTTHPGASIYGIYEGSLTGYLFDIHYNSIYIGGTGVTGGVSYGLYRGFQTIMNIKNNIIFNNRINSTGTGNHYCFYASNTGTGLTSNYNDFYVPNAYGYVGYWTANQATLANWRTASNQDFNSVSQNPNYVNLTVSPPDLHINTAIATRLESGGIPIAGITTDIDGDTRAGGSKIHNNVQPDIGADEFIGIALDSMPPAITYAPLANSPYTTNRTLTAMITDYVSGLANDPARAPRLFYKKGAAGTWVIDTVMTPTGNNWTFTFNHAKVGGVVVNDTIFYYVQATDSSNNTGTMPLAGATVPAYYRILVSMTGNYYIGTGYTYTTLQLFFNALNLNAIVGNVTGTIMSDITETVPDTLYQLSYFGGTWQVNIVPSLAPRTVYTISGAIAGPIVYLNGADNVTFNGMGKNLRFRNTSTSGKVFQLMNDATYNTITSCIIEGCGSSSSYPTIYIYTSTGTLGNSYNIISGNDIRDLSTTGVRPYCAFYCYGTATALNNSNTISNNNIFNFSYYGLYFGSVGIGGNWTISGNSFYYNNATLLSTGHYAIYFYPAATSNNNMIYGNFIGGSAPNCGGTAYTTSSSFYGIYAYSFGISSKSYIRKNTIKNITLTNTGSYAFYGIYVYLGTADIDSNTIGDPSVAARDLDVPSYGNNTSLSNTATSREERIGDNGMTLDIDVIQDQPGPDFTASTSTSTVIKPDRTENSISVAGTSVTYGIYSGTANPIKIEANEVSNMTASGTGTSVTCKGILAASSVVCSTYINSNLVHHIKSYGTSTSFSGTATGIYYWPSAFTTTGQIYNNTAYTIIAANTGAVATCAVGIIDNNTGISCMNNKTYDIQNASTGTTVTTPPCAIGMVVGATSYPAVYNNMISVGNGQTTNTEFIGIWNYFGTVNIYGLYNNSVWVTGTCTDGALPSFGYLRGNNTGTSVVTMTDGKNNILLNTRTGGTGKHYAIANQATIVDSFGWWFDYNVVKTSNPATLGLWGLTDLTFNDWKLAYPLGSGGDAHSINADPGYLGVTDLHINPNSQVPNRKAIHISGLTNDIDGDVRNPIAPDIGADEYTPNQPSVFSLITPLNGETNVLQSGQLIWHASNLAQYYDVLLDTLPQPVNKVSRLQLDTTYTYSGLLRARTYYWQIIAYNDTNPVSDAGVASEIWHFTTINIDVGCTKIMAPVGTFDSIGSVAPACSVYNYGTTTENYTVRMKIDGIYNNTFAVTNHAAGTYKVVTFPNWTVQRGSYAVTCSTELATDMGPNNDKATSQVTVTVRDVATTMIVSPTGTLLHGTTYPIHAKVKNLGTNEESFTARFKIGTIYNQVTEVSELNPNEEREIAFLDWVAVECNYTTSCSTELATDQINSNNKVTGSITVQRHDVGPITIISPIGFAYGGNTIIPRVKIRNFGYHTTETFNVTFNIGTIYTNTKTVTNLGPRDSTIVVFDQWQAVVDSYDIITYSSLTSDQTNSNDTLYSSLVVSPPVSNVGTVAILAPLDTILANVPVIPRAIVKNFGSSPATFTVRFKIDTLYNNVVTVTSLDSNAQQEVTFPSWNPVPCNHVASCSTEYAEDFVPENDKVMTNITVQYRDVGVVANLAPNDTVVTCNDYVPVIVVSNNDIHHDTEICTLSVRIVRYPIRMESAYCNIEPDLMNPVTIYDAQMIIDLPMGVDTIYMPTWHPYWWDMYASHHDVIASITMAGDMDETNNMLTSSFVVQSISNDIQMNWTGVLDIYTPMHAETIGVKTYNVASVVSTSPGGNDAHFRTWAKIIKEDDNAIVYSRYKDLNMVSGTYYCVPFQSGWSPTEPGWYRVTSWIQALPQYDVISENNSWVKRYYVTNLGPIAKINSDINQSVQGNSGNLPSSFGLMVNKPNPFSTHTTIYWQTPVATSVTITVYDASGRNIKTLVSKQSNPGTYSTTWDRTDNNNQKVAAGIYFYEMRADNYIARHKMVITH